MPTRGFGNPSILLGIGMVAGMSSAVLTAMRDLKSPWFLTSGRTLGSAKKGSADWGKTAVSQGNESAPHYVRRKKWGRLFFNAFKKIYVQSLGDNEANWAKNSVAA